MPPHINIGEGYGSVQGDVWWNQIQNGLITSVNATERAQIGLSWR